ncbi:MAG: hypothetical protein IPL55_06985 [Saprospiraceae bacterium]|jgi:hypothetical protein|nr:hypothetical protein [Saprospiraceae bacterium]
MKNVILVALLFTIHSLSGQENTKFFVNIVPLDSIKTEYVEVIGTSKLLSSKLNIELDFGQFNSIWKNSDTRLTNDQGKKVDLNSMIDALNFMSQNGYEYIDSYVLSNGNVISYHYILHKIKVKE